MVQRLITLCDRHNSRGQEVDADLPATTITIDGRATEIDMCAEHKAELNELLRPYYDAGRRPGRATLPLPPTRPSLRRTRDEDGVMRTPSGAISRARIEPGEDGKYYCKEPNCPRSEWIIVDGERVHGRPFKGPQGIYQHYVHNHGIKLTEQQPVAAGGE